MDSSNSDDSVRLNKFLALEMGLSRRQADDYIAAGRVKVNDQVAPLGARFQPDDKVEVDGKPITQQMDYAYILLNKPPGYVCSRRAQGEWPTVYSLLPSELHNLKPVGRLDQNSSGLILLTNDGDFTYRMTHPKFYKNKLYHVQLDIDLQPLHQQMISDYGVQLEDGPSKFVVARLEDQSESDKTTYEVTMSEGRNRQIRRTFAALGYEVTYLHRVEFGNYSLGDIKPGKYKTVDIR